MRSLLERFQAKVTAIKESRDIEANFCQPKKNKGIALSSTKERSNEADESDSEMGKEEMALFVKIFLKKINKW